MNTRKRNGRKDDYRKRLIKKCIKDGIDKEMKIEKERKICVQERK